MKIHMTSGCIYDIPKDVKCANLSIAFSDTELRYPPQGVDMHRTKLYIARRQNKASLAGFDHIGYEEIYKKDMHMQIDMHWFIDKNDLNKCTVSMEW